MPTRVIVGLVLMMASFWGRPIVGNQASDTEIRDPEAYAVYASVLSEPAKTKLAVLRRDTVTNWQCMPSGRPIQQEWRTVVDNLKKENAQVRTLVPGFLPDPPYRLVLREEIDSFFKMGPTGWDKFYARYPASNGYIGVSAVGFDETKTRAVVYMERACNTLCGGGTHHLLEKREGTWVRPKVADLQNCSWIS